ncbi:PhzF family phenazine biosynthesis protein [Marinithermus hydrothermalis]|uniref:Phenazine biosynthesis protein PhzF family n=1 Tax=Marinithermus hydrothermalis (strain DSM 14884 / JCM 11576 / T1) TaxID=869210 RepID=F2NQM4_MARHT|nr:PhzF family phenazine biosynthesis protein [Marinithermus hydrothermalis]AEB11962.1 phenazine biosynthesis protein PhzF family [Marinithermus hydrothermalis DSM 14884]
MKLPYLLVDAFTETPGTGNRAAVILDARGMSWEEMMRVAQRLAAPAEHERKSLEAVFVTHWEGPAFWVRFFTATREIEFAGHAAIALGLTLVREGRVPEGTRFVYLKTAVDTVPIEIEYQDGVPYRAIMRAPAPRFRDVPPWRTVEEVTEVLGANERYLHRGLPVGIAFTGLWSLFVPFVAPGLVDELEPDMARLTALCARLDVATVHAYAPLGPRTFYARDFAPALGIPEDPVTGSANGALAALLARAGVVPRREGSVEIQVLQGHRLGVPGTVRVRVNYGATGEPYAVYVGGGAVLAHAGVLED